MKKLIAISILLVFVSLPIYSSEAQIIFQGESTVGGGPGLITELSSDSPPGFVGDYEILFCTLFDDNSFNDPTPNWTPIIFDDCPGSPDCIVGLWGKFSITEEAVTNTCSWTQGANGSFMAMLRYSNVDPESPIIDSECSSGSSITATAPSINAEANSVVLRFFVGNSRILCFAGLDDSTCPVGTLPGFGFGSAFLNDTVIFFYYFINTIVTTDGPTPTVNLNFEESTTWSACTLALRAEPAPPTEVPTLSEWGMIAMAAILGFIGFLVIRRKKVTV